MTDDTTNQRRHELTMTLAGGAATYLAHAPFSADEIAQGIKTTVDALYPLQEPSTRSDAAKPACINGPFASPIALPVRDPGPDALEQEIQAKGLTAPRITPADIEANIASEHYFTALDGVEGATGSWDVGAAYALGLITFCVLITHNGTKLVGVNEGPVSPENFDAEMGRSMARKKAIDQLWPMLGYELRSKLASNT